jgi:glycosyltransferase involved in cell wall biosynthesis
MATLSVTIITKNEAKNIRRCLESIMWADEIIVLDSGSTDDTLAICKEYTSKIYSTDWPGFGPQKNRALSYATQDWVLSLDADEVVSDELMTKIQAILVAPVIDLNGYAINRPVVFLDKIIRHATGASKTIRFFKRGHGHFSDVQIHEELLVEGKVGYLAEPIYHYSFGEVADVLTKLNRYTSLVAEQRAARGKKGSLLQAIISAVWMFSKVYFFKLGFLDGGAGFILAISFAQGAYYRYVKLWALTHRNES